MEASQAERVEGRLARAVHERAHKRQCFWAQRRRAALPLVFVPRLVRCRCVKMLEAAEKTGEHVFKDAKRQLKLSQDADDGEMLADVARCAVERRRRAVLPALVRKAAEISHLRREKRAAAREPRPGLAVGGKHLRHALVQRQVPRTLEPLLRGIWL